MPATRSHRHHSPPPTTFGRASPRRSQRLQGKLGLSEPSNYSMGSRNNGPAGTRRRNPSILPMMQLGHHRSAREATKLTMKYEDSFITGCPSSDGSMYVPSRSSTDLSLSPSGVSTPSTGATPLSSAPPPSMPFVHPHGVKDREGFAKAPRHFLQIFCLALLTEAPGPSPTVEEAMAQEREELQAHLLKYPGWNMQPKRSYGVQTED